MNDRDIIINVNPTTGDSDFYVNCQLVSTGDDDGKPSKATGEIIYLLTSLLSHSLAHSLSFKGIMFIHQQN